MKARPLPPNWRHSDARLKVDTDRAASDLARLANGLTALLDRIRDNEAGQPGAQNTEQDRTSGTGTRRWCFVHDSDHVTIEDGVRMNEDCAHVQVIPSRADPTGETAISPDGARRDELDLLDALHRIAGNVEVAMKIASRNTPRSASSIARRQAEKDNQRWCESCSRIDNPVTGQPRQEWPHTQTPTTVGKRLGHPMILCRWCYDEVVRTGEHCADGPRLPYLEELLLYHGRGRKPRTREVS